MDTFQKKLVIGAAATGVIYSLFSLVRPKRVYLDGVDLSKGGFVLETKDGTLKGCLANALPNPTNPHVYVDAPAELGDVKAKQAMNYPDFVKLLGDDPRVNHLMKNTVKRCSQCGKPNAYTLANCNQCSNSLVDTEISFTNNIFSGFIFGVQRGPFPFKISIRYQDDDYLVFDDLLALTNCHVNVIPTSKFMSDWRFLLNDPAKGLQLLDQMYGKCKHVVKTQFWDNKAFGDKYQNRGDDAKVDDYIAAGFNFPPSQYQLHLQFMMLPLTPFHHYCYLKNIHYTKGRFFPVEYVRKVLSKNLPYPGGVNADTKIEDIITFYEENGVSYETHWQTQFDLFGAKHAEAARWDPADFRGVIVDDVYYKFDDATRKSATQIRNASVKAITGNDKNVLQNYGRPYGSNGRPGGKYYSHAKESIDELDIWSLL